MTIVFDDMDSIKLRKNNQKPKGYGTKIGAFVRLDDLAENTRAIEHFTSHEEAIPVFKDGARMAKGNTSEKGLVKSYFANPFGPFQKMEATSKLIDLYFNEFFKTGVKVWQIKTCLGIHGKEKEGPKQAAIELFEIIKSL